MNRYGMAVAAMCLTILGPVLASPHLGEWPVRELLLVLPMWVALELYIGLRRPFQGGHGLPHGGHTTKTEICTSEPWSRALFLLNR